MFITVPKKVRAACNISNICRQVSSSLFTESCDTFGRTVLPTIEVPGSIFIPKFSHPYWGLKWYFQSLHTNTLCKVKLSLCFTKHHAIKKMCWGSGNIAPRILDLGTRWRLLVKFTPRPIYPQGNSPCYPLDMRLGGPQSRSECDGE